ncbi:MAG: peptidase C69 [Candidatus Hecatellales archaeon B24]|nr:MAG: peptidase C69 [Candidatus Hecatellales archaeon B24]
MADSSLSLLDAALKAVKLCEAGGAEGEAYLSRTRTVSAAIENDQIVKAKTVWEEGLGLRVSLQGRIGFSYTNRLNMESLRETVRKALKLAGASQPDKQWKGFPPSKACRKTLKTCDGRVAEAEVEAAVDLASEMLEASLSLDGRVKASEGAVNLTYTKRVLANSLGVEVEDEGTWAGCYLEALAKEGLDTTPACFEFDFSRMLRLNVAEVGRKAAELALSALGAEKAESGRATIILGQPALLSILSYTLVPALKADNVQRGRSPLKGRIGEKVFSPLLTLVDDGLLEGGLNTSSFDDEGVPSQRTPLIERGVLKGFLYDHYRASKEGVESTGNAVRPASYASTPIIEPSNLVVKPSGLRPEDLLAETGRGFYVPYVQGAHSSNPESGEFSVVAAPVWLVEDGSLSRPVRSIMLAGTVYGMLENLSGLASNVRFFGSLVAPWVRVEEVRVIGS